mgnify:CR=1 FL=1
MNIIYTVIVAVICFTLVIGIDFLLQEISRKGISIFSKKWIRMLISYLVGIFIFLLIVKLIL